MLAALCLVLTLLLSYYYPRQQPLSLNPDLFVGTYRGFGWHDGPGLTGKNWTHVRCDEGDHGWWEVHMAGCGYGYVPCRGYYANGSLMEESVCLVEENGVEGFGDPAPDRHQVLHGKYYDPAGNLVSEINAGTGRQVLHYANGTKSWELELLDGRRVEHIMFLPSGHVSSRHRYDSEERAQGPYISNFEDGTQRVRGQYQAGERVGKWYRFFADGSVKTLEDHSTTPPTESEFAQGERFLDALELTKLETP